METYCSVSSLLLLVTLLVGGGLGFIRSLLLVGQSLPFLAEPLADVTC